MSEITESEERLARPLIRLAKLVGVGTSYLGMSHDYHEIDDDVLIEVLAALGIDASSESAQLIAIRRILNERYARLVAPTVLHIAGSEDRGTGEHRYSGRAFGEHHAGEWRAISRHH